MDASRKILWILTLGVFIIAFATGACKSTTGPDLKGGILTTFEVVDEQYSVFITNTETIDKVMLNWNKWQNAGGIPAGRVTKGQVSYNKPWSWHIDPEDISIVDGAIEIQDGRPSYVEANVDAWIKNVVYYSPSGAQLISVKDYR
jgi:hypothetical protein